MADKDMRSVIRGVMMDNKVPQMNNFAYAYPRFSKEYRKMILNGTKKLMRMPSTMAFLTTGILVFFVGYRYVVLGK